MPFDHRTVEQSLKKKGFRLEDRDHHYFRYYTPDGKVTRIHTKTSHNSQEIDQYLIKRMSKQTRLSSAQFKELISCNISAEEYYKILKDKGLDL